MKVGDKIRFRYTGTYGEIVEDFLDGSYRVYDPVDDEDMIAFAEDIVPAADFKGVEQSALAKQSGKKSKAPKLPGTDEIFFGKEEAERLRREELLSPLQKTPGKNREQQKDVPPRPEEQPAFVRPVLGQEPPSDQGLWLALYPQTPESRTVYLCNDTPHSFSFELSISLHGQALHRLAHSITPYTYFAVGEIREQTLYESPSMELRLPTIPFEKRIKIKAAKLITAERQAPLMGAKLPVFAVFEGKDLPRASADLQEYTRQMVERSKPKPPAPKLNPVEQQAHFVPEIDLHLEKLVSDPKIVTPAEILPLQLKRAEQFLNRSLELGLEEVFFIHGIGNGRLREALHRLLKKEDRVEKFFNNWHEKYGNGATYARLKKEE